MREHCLITASQQSPWPHCSHPQGTHCLLRMMSNSKGLRHRLALSTPVYQHLRTPPCPVLIPSFLWRFLPFLLLGPLLLVFHQHHLLVALLHLCPVQNVHLLSLISHPNHHIHVFHCHPVQNSHAQSRATTLPHHISPLSSPRPSNAPASALCDPTPLPLPVRQTRKRGNAGPLATEPKSKKSKGAGSTSGGASSTRNSPAVAKLSKGHRPRNSAVAGVTPMTSKNRSSSKVPDWFSRSLQMLQLPEITFGQSWADLVQQWVEFEQKEGFKERGKLGTADCPECILQWKKCACPSTWRPDISNVLSFEQEFRTWWISLQPTWWVSEGTMVTSMEGDWDVLRKPGQNGLICVLVGLFYWGRLVQEDENQCRGWAELVEDCLLILCQLAG